MNNKEKTIWYLLLNAKDIIAINYQDKNGDWIDKKMQDYYYTLHTMCVEIINRKSDKEIAKQEMTEFEHKIDNDIEAIEKLIEKEIENV